MVKVDNDYLIGTEVIIETDCLPILGIEDILPSSLDTSKSFSCFLRSMFSSLSCSIFALSASFSSLSFFLCDFSVHWVCVCSKS